MIGGLVGRMPGAGPVMAAISCALARAVAVAHAQASEYTVGTKVDAPATITKAETWVVDSNWVGYWVYLTVPSLPCRSIGVWLGEILAGCVAGDTTHVSGTLIRRQDWPAVPHVKLLAPGIEWIIDTMRDGDLGCG